MKCKPSPSVAALFALLLSANLFSSPLFPALQEPATEHFQPGKFIWADLFSADVESSIAFYTEAFGWEVRKTGNDKDVYYHLISEGIPIAGIVYRPLVKGETDRAVWVSYISTNDVHTITRRSEALGSKVFLEPRQLGHRGTHAIISDPYKGIVGLLKSDSGDPVDESVIAGSLVWAQLFSVDPEGAVEYYSTMFGYEAKEAGENQNSFILSHDGRARAGIVPLPQSLPQRDRWVGFVRVEDLDKVLSKAAELDARIIYAPRKEMLDGRLAIIADPNGALIGLIAQPSIEKVEE